MLFEQLALCGCTFQLKRRCIAAGVQVTYETRGSSILFGGFNGQKVLGHLTDTPKYLWPHAGRMVNGRLSLAPDEVALQ